MQMAHTSIPELFTRLGRLHPQGFHMGSSSGDDQEKLTALLPVTKLRALTWLTCHLSLKQLDFHL